MEGVFEKKMTSNLDIFLSVVIPAYNEERRLPHTHVSTIDYLSRQSWNYEIIVVSDGSSDNTVNIVKQFKHGYENIIILDNEQNRGKGYAVRQGMIAARGHLKLFMDADNATKINEIEKLLPFVPTHDVVIGSIGALGAHMTQRETIFRIIAGKLGNLFIRLLLIPGIYDTQRGFKLFTKKAADEIFPRLVVSRWGFDVEALALARASGFLIKEIPIIWSHQQESKVGMLSYANVLVDVLRIRWRLWQDLYNIKHL